MEERLTCWAKWLLINNFGNKLLTQLKKKLKKLICYSKLVTGLDDLFYHAPSYPVKPGDWL